MLPARTQKGIAATPELRRLWLKAHRFQPGLLNGWVYAGSRILQQVRPGASLLWGRTRVLSAVEERTFSAGRLSGRGVEGWLGLPWGPPPGKCQLVPSPPSCWLRAGRRPGSRRERESGLDFRGAGKWAAGVRHCSGSDAQNHQGASQIRNRNVGKQLGGVDPEFCLGAPTGDLTSQA